MLTGVALLAMANPYFVIQVVDDQTGRGVPLVELRTTSDVRYYTDSAGIVAFHEPGLMGQEVYFHVSSHGFEHEADGFGYRGRRLKVVPGGRASIRIKRINIAERLYRVTGQGIYRDSLLAHLPAPIAAPALNAQVMGLDTVMFARYRGKMFWVFGDTNRPGYPLGHFATSTATSLLPRDGGLDPERGINLTYFTDATGFAKKMVPLEERGMVWLHAMTTLKDDSGRERLIAHFGRMKSLTERLESGLVVFNDEKQIFQRLVSWGAAKPVNEPAGRPFRVTQNGRDYLYFVWPFAMPLVRVTAEWQAIQDPAQYESFSCDPDCHWRKGMAARDPGYSLLDLDTGQPVRLRMCTAHWNPYRRRWIAMLENIPSDIYYAEAPTPTGPWVWTKKIITHDKYTFYWSAHIPHFDRDGGRRIYIMGTYTSAFSGAPFKTPRYDYNQILYALNLDDPRLMLPEPVYRSGSRFAIGTPPDAVDAIPYFAFPEDRHPEGLQAAVLPGGLTVFGRAASHTEGQFWRNPLPVVPMDRGSRAGVIF